MYETIQLFVVCKALQYLLDTPLYKKYDIQIDSDFFQRYSKEHNEETDFIADDNSTLTGLEIRKSDILEKSLENEINDNDFNTVDINDEVMIVDRNQETVDNTHVIVPGQSKAPES